jgi:hypothetical protein
LLDCRHVCKTCVFHDDLQAGKQKEVHPPYSPDLAPAGARSGEYGRSFRTGVSSQVFSDQIRTLSFYEIWEYLS